MQIPLSLKGYVCLMIIQHIQSSEQIKQAAVLAPCLLTGVQYAHPVYKHKTFPFIFRLMDVLPCLKKEKKKEWRNKKNREKKRN